MNEIVREIGRTVREAIRSWPETVRLCVLLAVATAAVLVCYHLFGP
jgi:hypothetical protein